MGKEGRRFLPNLKKLGSPRLNFDEDEEERIDWLEALENGEFDADEKDN
jgi:hypothetical protein